MKGIYAKSWYDKVSLWTTYTFYSDEEKKSAVWCRNDIQNIFKSHVSRILTNWKKSWAIGIGGDTWNIHIEIEGTKLFLYANNIITYIETPRKSTK